ncbi:hypothetical protein Trydic_g12372 [Trypoxylus dichotomus]
MANLYREECTHYSTHIKGHPTVVKSYRFRMSRFVVLVSLLTAYATALPTQMVDQGSYRVGNCRIYGGTDAADGAYPFMVSLRIADNKHFCGGSIITERWILTSGHCVLGRNAADVMVVVGTNKLNSGGIFTQSCEIVIHPNFNDTEHLSNDIAMVLLRSPLRYNTLIAPAILSYDPTESTINTTMIGWGRTRRRGHYANRLQEFSTQTLRRIFCNLYDLGTITPQQICAKYQRGKAFCEGDVGGPLLQTNTKEQVGIASYHHKNGCGVKPDVYTRVASYTGWIQETIRSRKHRC